MSLLSLLLVSCGSKICKNTPPSSLFKQVSSVPHAHINNQYREVYIMGDSLSDTGAFVGTLNSILGIVQQEFHELKWVKKIYFSPPFYKGASFSDGPVAVEYVAGGLGLPMTAGWSFQMTPKLKQWIVQQKSKELSIPVEDILRKERLRSTAYTVHDQIGTNYAVSNARASVGDALPDVLLFNQFQLKNQLNTIIRHHPDIGEDDLFIIMIGGNDIMAAAFSKDATGIINESITEISNVLNILAKRNIKHIVVGNVPDIGLIPVFVNTDKQLVATQLTQDFNQKLNNKIENFRKIYPEIDIRLFDMNNTLKNLLVDYKKNGKNISQACISDIADHQNLITLLELLLTGELRATYNSPCSKLKICNYLFFDYFHPSALPHKTAGDALYNLIVNPGKV